MGGTVAVESMLGEGALFRVEIPVHAGRGGAVVRKLAS
jgi:hypothetical protein